jgi:hypothetical protein
MFFWIGLLKKIGIKMNDYENMNGLVNGKIPMGVQCPFRENCIWSKGNWIENKDLTPEKAICRRPQVMKVDFSCALARAFSLRVNMNMNMNKEK